MPSMKDIRTKISSTKSTQQITKAMKMVSAAKLRKAQMAAADAKAYSHKMAGLISQLAGTGNFDHPLLKANDNPKNVLVIAFTSDRGLCGGFNANIIKTTERFIQENKQKYDSMKFIFFGRRGGDHFKKRDVDIVDNILDLAGRINFKLASDLAKRVTSEFMSGQYDEVRIIFTEFKSAISQEVISETILPIKAQEAEEGEAEVLDYIFEPNGDEILKQLLPKHFAVQIFKAMLESVASEHGARMTAMDSATSNAGEVIRSLTLTYNKLRQAAITRELVEIVSGAEAL